MGDFPFWAIVAFVLGWRALGVLAAELLSRRDARDVAVMASAELVLSLDKRLGVLEAEAQKSRLREGLARR